MNLRVLTKKRGLITLAICVILAVSSIIILQMNQTTEAALIDPHPGLVGWWRFDEESGTVASDSSGNGNDGTVYGETWVTGKFGNALSFDGISNYVQAQNSWLPQAPLTISCWFKTAATVGTQELIAERYDRFGLYLAGSSLIFQIYDSAVHSVSFGPISANTWYLAAAVYNTTGVYLFLNGTPVADNEGSFGSILYLDGVMRVGAEVKSSPTNFFNGMIDEVRVYNRTLSINELKTDYQAGPTLSSNVLVKVPQGTTQLTATLSWQGPGSINVTITSPAQTYTENMLSEYQKTSYATSGDGVSAMLNIKRLSVSVSTLPSDQSWSFALEFDNVDAYQISIEVQK